MRDERNSPREVAVSPEAKGREGKGKMETFLPVGGKAGGLNNDRLLSSRVPRDEAVLLLLMA